MPNQPSNPSVPKNSKEIGATGTYLMHGYLSLHDYNSELTGITGITIYDKMRKSDPTVRVSLMAIVLPLLSAHWYMEPADDSKEEKQKAEFMEYALLSGETGISWRHFLEEAVKLYLSYGRMFYEKVFGLIEFDGKTYIGWQKFGSRHPETVLRYAIGEGDSERFGITQTLPDRRAEIPGEKLIALVNEKEGDNWEGLSVLRSSYKPWYIKEQLEKIEAIKAERQGMGVPYAQAKAGWNPTPEERSKIQTALKNIRANENAFIEAPQGYEIGWMKTEASSTHDIMPFIDYNDRQIVKNVLAQFMEIGGKANSSGSFAASDNQMDLFILSLQSIATYLCEAVQQQAIKQLIDFNWPGSTTYPKLRVDKIGPDNATKLAENLLKFVQAKLITPTDEDEIFLRSVNEMPDMPEELIGTVDRSLVPPPVEPGEDEKKKEDKKSASEALIEVKKLRDEVLHALYG